MALSRKDILAQAFVAAGDRGLTAKQMRAEIGRNWQRWLDELKDAGYMFREVPSRYGRDGAIYRWVLTYEPGPAVPAVEVEPEQLALLDGHAGVRPASALEAA